MDIIMTLFHNQAYFNRLDLLSKFMVGNIHQIPCLDSFVIENKVSSNNKLSLKDDVSKFYTLLLFYLLTLRLPYIFFKKKKSLYFKLKYLESKNLIVFLNSFALEKNIVLKKKINFFFNQLSSKMTKTCGISFNLFLPNFYLNSTLADIFGDFTFLKIQNLKFNVFMKTTKKLQINLKKLQLELFFANYNLLWLFS